MTVPAGVKTPTVVHVSVCAISGCTFCYDDTEVCRLSCSVSVGAVSDCTSCHGDTDARCLAVYQLVLSVTAPLAVKTEVRRLSCSVSVGAVSDCTSCCEDRGTPTVMQCICRCCQ